MHQYGNTTRRSLARCTTDRQPGVNKQLAEPQCTGAGEEERTSVTRNYRVDAVHFGASSALAEMMVLRAERAQESTGRVQAGHMDKVEPRAPAPALALEEFSALLDRSQWPLFTFLRGIVGEEEQARDLMQDTFCEAWRMAQRAAAPFDPSRAESEARRWLFHVAYHRAISALRHRRAIRWESLDEPGALGAREAHAPRGLPGEFEDRIAERQALAAALTALSTQDAACLLLVVVYEFTAAEVGQIVGVSAQAVAKRFARAKQRLRDAYLVQSAEPREVQQEIQKRSRP
jgi:RNA polymerase sigma factor (sigma-70 family)